MRETRPYLIAEMGVNFFDTARAEGISPMEAAKRYIDAAAEAGCDCAKFQSYKAGTIVSGNSPAYWDLAKEPTATQYELFRKHDSFGEAEFAELCAHAHARGMDFTSTPFDYESADYLEKYVDFYKVSSSDLSNLPFVEHVGAKGKPVAISTGASYLSEVDEAVRALEGAGCADIALLHCVLSYPTSPDDANLRVVWTLKEAFPGLRVGYSDHVAPDPSMATLSAAYLMGAEVIEKHFTLDKALPGNDHYHSGDPGDFRRAVENFRWIDRVLGGPGKTVLPCEEAPRREARRSLVLARDVRAGEAIRPEDLVPKRPGTGIPPRFAGVVAGRAARRDLPEDTVLTWDMV